MLVKASSFSYLDFVLLKLGNCQEFFDDFLFQYTQGPICYSWVPNAWGRLNKRGDGNPSKKLINRGVLINGGGVRNSQKTGFYVIYWRQVHFTSTLQLLLFLKEDIQISLRSALQ